MGSGGAGRAQRAAEQAEAERQSRIIEGTGAVNRIFDAPERSTQIQDFLNALRERFVTGLNRQKTDVDRRSRFALARSGLVGGSAAVDQKRRLGEEYVEGLMNAENRAQGAAGDLRMQDEQARLDLIRMVQSGLDTTTAAQRAGSAMQASAQGAMGGALAKGLGDAFGATADTYRRMEEGAARRRGMVDSQVSVYGKPFSG